MNKQKRTGGVCVALKGEFVLKGREIEALHNSEHVSNSLHYDHFGSTRIHKYQGQRSGQAEVKDFTR